jgi:glycosyltransferase involved in cell wall biosynthesis
MIVVSKPLFDNLSASLQLEDNIIYFDTSPAAIFGGNSTRKKIKKIEQIFKPNLIYSIGFPSYIKFKTPEVGRYTNPWEINSPPLPWHTIKPTNKLKIFLGIKYRLMWARNAAYFETQTEAAKLGIMRKLDVRSEKVMVIPNSPNPIFSSIYPILYFNKNETIKIFCLGAPHKHKNLEIIPEVAIILKNKHSLSVRFFVTIPAGNLIGKKIEVAAEKLKVKESIINLGKIDLNSCLEWYRKIHIVFLPTLLEVFSATYVEAMAMRKPIVTTDFEFATDVCGDAALYYQGSSAEAAADKIAELVFSNALQIEMVERGKRRLAHFPNPEEKFRITFDWLESLAQCSRNNFENKN